ncbi:MAG: hypothetical protein DRP08_02250 [Candidatus Aenigmatarchaeota archaeon]|nr:MAG: hypothetical protein DRP08_02250 [Candidatus Aenigmarchaeota archaeon]
MTLSQLVIKRPLKGSIKGTCVWCGLETKEGHKIKVSDNFTGWSYFGHGNCMCPYCYSFFCNQNFRRRSWFATEKETRFIKRNEVLGILLEPPQLPWFLYIVKNGQKQGWLSCIHKVNFTHDVFYIAYEPFEQPVMTTRRQVEQLSFLIERLRALKISKAEIQKGEFKMKTWERAIKGNYDGLLRVALKEMKTPIWEVLCHVSK